jgi:hypothetical protein
MATMDIEPVQTLENAMHPIIDEMFKNGFEQGCLIWDDLNHPLAQAIHILMRAKASFHDKEKAMALIEHHRRMEEGL